MKAYILKTLCAITLMGCVDIDINPRADSAAIITLVGPDHDADVQLADADIWIVPSFFVEGSEPPEKIVWRLLHPNVPATVVVRRTCAADAEPYLWLSDPPDWTSALATFHPCGTPGEFYSTVELAYDGSEWVGLSATGAATILPPQ
jgi:hypothetical protein